MRQWGWFVNFGYFSKYVLRLYHTLLFTLFLKIAFYKSHIFVPSIKVILVSTASRVMEKCNILTWAWWMIPYCKRMINHVKNQNNWIFIDPSVNYKIQFLGATYDEQWKTKDMVKSIVSFCVDFYVLSNTWNYQSKLVIT